jgi:WD40 repeat protein
MIHESDTTLDFEIHITARRDAHYPVRIRLGDEQDFHGTLAADAIPSQSTSDPMVDGRVLFDALFADPQLRRAWDMACGKSQRRRVRLWLDADAPELHALPWETLHDGETWLAASAATPFSRYLPSDAPWGGLVTERPLRILSVIANPADLARYSLAPLDVAAERSLLTEALGDLVPQHFELEHLAVPVTLERLESTLAAGPHILHFVGHGKFSQRRGEAALYLQDAAGNTKIITEAQLVAMLRRQAAPPHLIFLAACQSAERSTADAFAGLAPKLVQAGVPAVVAMRARVAMGTARRLSRVFYSELVARGAVDRALNAARSALLTTGSADVATPVLLMRLRDGQLWEPLWVQTNPYRGLAAFTEADADFFCGREQLVEDLKNHLRRHPRFLAVVGPSGSGKSSVVQAGLLPTLRRGDLPRSEEWQIVSARPGDDPYASLDLPSLLSPERDRKRRLVLFIDQFEELFALCPPEVQTCFLNDLHTLITGTVPATVILTLRADFYGHVLRHPLGERLAASQVNVLPMQPEELRTAVETPAHQVGLEFEAGLVESIVEDARAADHALPLLQSALAQLWRRQDHGTLTYAAYQDVGRVAGALGLWAENAYAAFTAEEQRLTRRIFTRLVHFSEGEGADTRQRRKLDELAARAEERESMHRLVRQLADARLLVTDEVEGDETVEIIHDMFIKAWPRLVTWLTEQREFYLWRQRLDTQLQMWEDQERAEDALLRGDLLAEAVRWMQTYPDDLNQDERTFIQAGQEAEERRIAEEEARRQRELEQARELAEEQHRRADAQARFTQRLRIALGVVVVALVAAIGLFFYANYQAGRAQDAEVDAQQRAEDAEAAQLVAEYQSRISRARELAALSMEAMERDPELSLLLAVASCNSTLQEDGTYVNEAEEALDNALGSPFVGTLRGHTDGVNRVDFNSDGSLIVTAGLDGTARIWDSLSREALAILDTDPSWDEMVEVATFSPDDQRILTANFDGTARLWNAQNYTAICELIGHTQAIQAAAFDSTGLRIVTASSDGTARIWDGKTCAILHILEGHSDQIWSVAFSPDDQKVVTASHDGTARVWYVQDGALIKSFGADVHTGYVRIATFSPDGRVIATVSGSTTFLWRATDQTLLAQLEGHQKSISSVVFSPDGTHLVTTSGDYTARVWDTEKGTLITTLSGHTDDVIAADFSPDGDWIVTASSDGTARVWDVHSGASNMILRGHNNYVMDVQFSPDSEFIVTGSADNTARIWSTDLNPNQIAVLGGHQQSIIASGEGPVARFSPDGSKILSAGYNFQAKLWEFNGMEGAKLISELSDAGLVWDANFSPDGDRIFTACANGDCWGRMWNSADGTAIGALTGETNGLVAIKLSVDGSRVLGFGYNDSAWLYEGDSGDLITTLGGHEGWIKAADISSDGQRIATVGDEVIRLWEVETSEPILTSPITGSGFQVAFSPDSKLLAMSTGNTGTVSLRDGRSGKLITNLQGHSGRVNSLAFIPDSTYLATASDDNKVKLWDVTTHTLIATFTGHKGPVNTIDFDSTGTYLATGSNDNTVCVWNLDSQRLLSTFVGHTGDVRSVHFSPDGHFVVSAGEDDTVRVWRVVVSDIETKMAIAVRRAARSFTFDECHKYFPSVECPIELLAVPAKIEE